MLVLRTLANHFLRPHTTRPHVFRDTRDGRDSGGKVTAQKMHGRRSVTHRMLTSVGRGGLVDTPQKMERGVYCFVGTEWKQNSICLIKLLSGLTRFFCAQIAGNPPRRARLGTFSMVLLLTMFDHYTRSAIFFEGRTEDYRDYGILRDLL